MAPPPGPQGFDLLRSILGIKRDTLKTLIDLTQNYGDLVSCRLGIWPAVLVNDPDLIGYFLQTNWTDYSKRTPFYNMIRWSLGNGLATSDGAYWLRQRRSAQPSFSRPNLVQFGGMMSEFAGQALEEWMRGQALDLMRAMTRLTLRIVGQALFSLDLTAASSSVEAAVAVLQEETSRRWRSLLPMPPWLPTARDRRFREALQSIDDIVEDLIRQRRRSPAGHEDLLSALMTATDRETGQAMTDLQLRDELVTFLLTGHETITNAIVWMFSLLSLHPDIRRRVEAEVDAVLANRPPTPQDLERLPLCRRVVEETLRLYPTAWGFVRLAEKANVVGGYQIPKYHTVCISPYVVHRHPRYWENPEGFDPDRFLPENSKNRPKFAYIPFGGGPRACIGNHFALMEAHLILACVTQKARLDLVPGQSIQAEALVTLCPRQGIKMNVQSRLQVASPVAPRHSFP